MLKKPGLILLLVIFVSCSTTQTYVNKNDGNPAVLTPPPEEELLYRLYLIGDAGGSTLKGQEPTLRLFQSFLEKAKKQSTAIFLGDNIYMNGLPDSAHPRRLFYEHRIIEQMKTVQNFPGRVIFIPGNHDWDDGGKKGLAAVNRQEQFVESYLDRGNTFLPDNGFPGPVEVELMDDDDDPRLKDDIRLVILDTQWWLHKYEKSFGDTGEYELHDGGDFITELDDILKKRRNDFVTVIAHHPMISHGAHGGYLSPKAHLIPPVFGSLYAAYRRVFGLEQDIPHYRYREMRNTLMGMFGDYEDLVYVSGHAHNLQYHKVEGKRNAQHYIISGAGTKENYVAHGRGAEFTHNGSGFVTIQYYGNGSVWMEAWIPVGDGTEGKMIYRNRLKGPYDDPLLNVDEEEIPDISYSDSTVTMAANKNYDNKSKVFEFIAGSHNRKYWSVPAEFPVFDVTEVKGGLTPERLGGKGQSNTLHLETEEGREYVLRSVDKEAGRIWDENLRKTFALDLAQDQFSILNPYAALVIPVLADAAGVYHTNPKIYYIPDDPHLGAYGDELAGELALFEEKPDDDVSHIESMGRSEEVLSHAQFIREVDGDIDHRVDQEAFARARILDMLLADWDRHSDQWRWASFEPPDEQGKIYVPIPRDRDVALMKMNGIVPTLAKLGPFFQYQNFEEGYGNLKGLNHNSLALTRRFTNQLTHDDWLRIAKTLETALTDEVIEKAVQNYPAPVFEKFGEETASILKARRDKLVNIVDEYYRMISGVVSVPGSNKRELFEVEIINDDEVSVRVYKMSRSGETREQYYHRLFKKRETNQIRLFGMGGDDRFEISGISANPIKIIIVGGSGSDDFKDRTPAKGLGKNIEIYDTERGNNFETGKNTKVHVSDDPLINRYDYESDFRWNRAFVGVFTAYNDDDGLFLGGGPRIVRNNFRRLPASAHYIRANYALKTGAANVKYSGTWYEAAGDWNTALRADILLPRSYRNFFGLGNETTLQQRNSNYYRARLTRAEAEPRFFININNVLSYYAGVMFSITDVERDPENIVTDPQLGIFTSFKQQWYTGALTGFTIRDLDNRENPRQGYVFSTAGEMNAGVYNTPESFGRIKSELEVYYSIRFVPQITLANRTGSAHNFGDFPFYESNSIGGTTNLRGFRGSRFSGRTSFYNNTEIRMELFDFYRYLLGGKVGVSGFFDTGRVWADGEISSVWHYGYGGGVWFNLFESFLVSSTLGASEEGILFAVKAGFLF